MTWLKKLAAPNFWPHQDGKFRPHLPGPHSQKNSIPLVVLLRDYLGVAETAKECRDILNRGLVKVNGKVISKSRFSVGLMDVIVTDESSYVVLPTQKGLAPVEESNPVKLSRIDDKTSLKGGVTQLNLHDGRNINVEDDKYSTGDVVTHEGSSIKEHMKFEEGVLVLIIGGKNVGMVGELSEVKETNDFRKTTVTVKANGKDISVPKDYVFVIGEDKPVFSLGEE